MVDAKLIRITYEDDKNKLGHEKGIKPDCITTLFGALGYRVLKEEIVEEDRKKYDKNSK
jgi:hypothetical protein